MRSLKLAKLEFQRLLKGGTLPRLALVVVAAVPLLYGALYLWAFWDPYSRIERIPVALVNEDRPVRAKDATLTVGDDLTRELLDGHKLDWRRVSSAEAADGLAHHRYYMSLTVPADFSARLASASGTEPVRATLRVAEAQGDNMLASQIGDRVMSAVKEAAARSASRGYFDAALLGIHDAGAGLKDAADGAATLSNGLGDAKSGAGALADGLDTAATGTRDLRSGLSLLDSGAKSADDGARQLADGASRLHGGLAQLKAGSPALAGASAQLATGASQLDAGVQSAVGQIGQAATAATQLKGGAGGVKGALDAYAAAHPEAASDPTFAAALAGSAQVSGGLSQLSGQLAGAAPQGKQLLAGAAQVSGGSAKLRDGLGTYTAGVVTAADGAVTLDGGLAELRAGTARLADGTAQARSGARDLSSGVARLDDGARALASGLTDAKDGGDTLASGLADGASHVPVSDGATRDRQSYMMSNAVALITTKTSTVPNYGTGFAPYFIPLALWVGSLIAYLVMRPVSGRALASTAPDWTVALGGYWPAAILAAVQASMLLAVVRFGLGLQPGHILALYAFTVLVGLTFVALLQFLNVALKAAGKFVAIVLLMLQLTSAAGTFPLQTVPSFFQAINPFLPMTYAVQGIRQAVSGGDMHLLAIDAAVLCVFLVMSVLGTMLSVRRRRTWTMDRLHPTLEI